MEVFITGSSGLIGSEATFTHHELAIHSRAGVEELMKSKYWRAWGR
jgi:hypothetical protein